MNRKLLWAVLAIGAVLVALPLAFQMPTRAAAGERMISDFQPIMQPDQVQKTADYYTNVFVPLDKVFTPLMTQQNVQKFTVYVQGFSALGTEAQALVPAFAQAYGVSNEQAQSMMAQQFPAMTAMLQSLPTMQRDFEGLLGAMAGNTDVFAQVPAGIAHYKPLVETMQGNVDDYAKAAALPSFTLLPWFFIVPGVLLVALAGWGLLAESRVTHRVVTRPTPTH